MPTKAEEIKTQEQIDKEIKELENKKIQLHINEETKKIKSIKCKSCDTNLKLKPKDIMKKGRVAKMVACPKCEMMNRVLIVYENNPEVAEGLIQITAQEYAWETLAPSNFNEKHIKKWIAEENKRIINNMSRFPRREEQILVRALDILLNK